MTEEKDLFKEDDHHGPEHGHEDHADGRAHGHHEHEHHDHAHHDHLDHDHHNHEHHDHEHREKVHISHHEGAVIGAMQGTVSAAGYDEAEKLLAGQMKEAGRRVTEAGGIIGHIKFIITEAGRCGQISVTDIDDNIKQFAGGGCRAEGVAIVLGIDDAGLTEILTDTVGKILEQE